MMKTHLYDDNFLVVFAVEALQEPKEEELAGLNEMISVDKPFPFRQLFKSHPPNIPTATHK